MKLVAQVRQATALLEAASKAIAEVEVDEAVRLAGAFAQAEKVAMAATRRAVLRAGDEGAKKHGGDPTMAALIARLTGTSVAKATQGLKSAERAGGLAGVHEAYVAGSLSFDQAALVTDAAVVDPAAAPELVAEATRTSLAGLRAKAAQRRAARQGEAARLERERSLAARRFCRVAPLAAGGVRLEAVVPSEEGAALHAALGAAGDAHWRAARAAGRTLTTDQARADALVALCTGTGTATAEPAPPEVVVTVDAAALVKGATAAGEVCVIDGVGPVPVATARGLLGEALLTICVTEGKDVRTVTSTTRVVPTRVRKALALRDPACVVPGCGRTRHLEIDHWRLDFSRGGLSALDNLCRLCAPHHRLKTRTGWRLEGGPGRWRWLPPPLRRPFVPRARRPEARAPV